MRNMLKTIGTYFLFAAAFSLAALFALTVLDVFLSKAFLIFIPGVFGFTKVMLFMIVFFAAIYIVCHRLSTFQKKKKGGAGS